MERIIFISFFLLYIITKIYKKNPYKIKKSIYNAKKTYVFYLIHMILLEKNFKYTKNRRFRMKKKTLCTGLSLMTAALF